MNMIKSDFKLLTKDMSDGHEDYWFEVLGATREYLTDKYMEQAMKAVFK